MKRGLLLLVSLFAAMHSFAQKNSNFYYFIRPYNAKVVVDHEKTLLRKDTLLSDGLHSINVTHPEYYSITDTIRTSSIPVVYRKKLKLLPEFEDYYRNDKRCLRKRTVFSYCLLPVIAYVVVSEFSTYRTEKDKSEMLYVEAQEQITTMNTAVIGSQILVAEQYYDSYRKMYDDAVDNANAARKNIINSVIIGGVATAALKAASYYVFKRPEKPGRLVGLSYNYHTETIQAGITIPISK